MNEVVNKCLLAEDKFMDRLLNIVKETGNLKHIYKNELDKACFAHDAACPDSKDLAARTISDKVLKDRA